MRIEECFDVHIAEDGMTAYLTILEKSDEQEQWELDVWESFLKANGVVYGIKHQTLEAVVEQPQELTFPLVIAEGISPQNGTAAFIQSALIEREVHTSRTQAGQQININLKQVIDIPMAEEGELVGEKVEATPGVDGTTVTNESIKAKAGRDFVLRPGKNTRIEGNQIYALSSGQVSVHKKTVHVYPVYEVSGDLDLQTGNIDFTGNVEIRGNVPSGFEVKAKGDIRVRGTVEGAFIEAGGSVYIGEGISAQHKGYVEAGKDIQATYLNEAHVEAGDNIVVQETIMHSRCHAGGDIICLKGRGLVVGGSLSAVSAVCVKEAGNVMNTKTSFFLGAAEQLINRQKEHEQTLVQAKNESLKLQKFLKDLDNKKVPAAKNRVMKLRARNALKTLQIKAKDAAEELEVMHDVWEDAGRGYIIVKNQLHENVVIHFGKYSKTTRRTYSNVKVTYEEGDIHMKSL
ncbi:hypothetical protein SAMN05192534_101236 [Alteribacillus persepolensis]|uniref:Flagellar Assembly Protein A N-terminal region domain-containing protein n=1 Tax=Alteribacillus persepolensis TaxID=568899 RepID=A0A1G7YQM1_9BACI|nr:FapA family protein [Alteribacillus persepolensis]SDG98707.1 hypothetical protein SAMN05192534_101236 [Alteribacillus persepolensis]